MNITSFHCSKEPGRSSGYCHFHPTELFVGVCPLCLNERLLTLASLKQRHYNKLRSQQRSSSSTTTRGHSFSLTTKISALGSLMNRLELKNHKTFSELSGDQDYNSGSSSSQEDSFISIKFEENGVAYWDKDSKSENNQTTKDILKDSSEQRRHTKQSNTLMKPYAGESSNIYKSKMTTVIENIARPRGATLGWRKRIGHIFDHIRWRSSSNTNLGVA